MLPTTVTERCTSAVRAQDALEVQFAFHSKHFRLQLGVSPRPRPHDMHVVEASRHGDAKK